MILFFIDYHPAIAECFAKPQACKASRSGGLSYYTNKVLL